MHKMKLLVFLTFMASAALAMPKTLLKAEERIVNGSEAAPGKYPSMVSVKYLGKHSCGGTILNSYWVLTAAHCITTYIIDYVKVYSGSVDLLNGGVLHPAVELIPHKYYDNVSVINDIGLIKVATPFTWDENTQPVKLPKQGQFTAGDLNATVIGWGSSFTGGGTMIRLQEVDYWTVTDETCQEAHVNSTLLPTNICAYYPGGGKGQCSGDSGGPLWVYKEQVGIVSWSMKPCTIAPYPGVFTEVSAYIDWINYIVN